MTRDSDISESGIEAAAKAIAADTPLGQMHRAPEIARKVIQAYLPFHPPASREAGLREALQWYADQVRDCRKITSEGDNARHALDRDGGERAREAIKAAQ